MSTWDNIRKQSAGIKERLEDLTGRFIPVDEMGAADLGQKLNAMLKEGIVHFVYKKKAAKGQPWDSGSEREAWGTKNLHMELMTKMPNGGDCPPKRAGYSIYFDVEKEDWRAFNDMLLVGVYDRVYDDSEFRREHKSV